MSFYVPLYFIVYCLGPSWFICERTKKGNLSFFMGSGYLSKKTESHFLFLFLLLLPFLYNSANNKKKRRYNFSQLSIAAAGQNKTSGKIHLTSSQEIGEKRRTKVKGQNFHSIDSFFFYLSLFCDLWNPSGFNFVPFISPLKKIHGHILHKKGK